MRGSSFPARTSSLVLPVLAICSCTLGGRETSDSRACVVRLWGPELAGIHRTARHGSLTKCFVFLREEGPPSAVVYGSGLELGGPEDLDSLRQPTVLVYVRFLDKGGLSCEDVWSETGTASVEIGTVGVSTTYLKPLGSGRVSCVGLRDELVVRLDLSERTGGLLIVPRPLEE